MRLLLQADDGASLGAADCTDPEAVRRILIPALVEVWALEHAHWVDGAGGSVKPTVKDVEAAFTVAPSPMAKVLLGIMVSAATPALSQEQQARQHRPSVLAGWMSAQLTNAREPVRRTPPNNAAARFCHRNRVNKDVFAFVSSSLKVATSRQSLLKARDKQVWTNDYQPSASVCGRVELEFETGAPADIDGFADSVRRALEQLVQEMHPECAHPAPTVCAATSDPEVVTTWPEGALTRLQTDAVAKRVEQSPILASGMSTSSAKATTAVLPHADLMATMKLWSPSHPLIGTVNEVGMEDTLSATQDNVNWRVSGAFKQITGRNAGTAITALNLANQVYFPVMRDKLLRDVPGIDTDPGRGELTLKEAIQSASSLRLDCNEQARISDIYYGYLKMDLETPPGMVKTRKLTGEEHNNGMTPATMGIGGNIMVINTNTTKDMFEHCEASLAEVREILIQNGATERADGSLFIRLKTFKALPYLTYNMGQDGAPFLQCVSWEKQNRARNTIYTGADDFAVEFTPVQLAKSPAEQLALFRLTHPTCREVVLVREGNATLAVPVFSNSLLKHLIGPWHCRNALGRCNTKIGDAVFRRQQVQLNRAGGSAEFVLTMKGGDPTEYVMDAAANRLAYHSDLRASCPEDNPSLTTIIEYQLKRAAECPLSQAMFSRNKADTMLSALQDCMDAGDMPTVVLLLRELRCLPSMGNSATYNKLVNWAVAYWQASSPIAKLKQSMYDTARETSEGSGCYTSFDQNFENCQKLSKTRTPSATIDDLRALNVELRDGNGGYCLTLGTKQHETESSGGGRTRSTRFFDRDLVTSYKKYYADMKVNVVGAPLSVMMPTGERKEVDHRAFVLSDGRGMNPDLLDLDEAGDTQSDRVVGRDLLELPGAPPCSAIRFQAQAKTGAWGTVGQYLVEHGEDGLELFGSYYDTLTGEVCEATPRGTKPTAGKFVASVDTCRKRLKLLRDTGESAEAKTIGAWKELLAMSRLDACKKLCKVNLAERLHAEDSTEGESQAPERPVGCDVADLKKRDPVAIGDLPIRLRSLGRDHRLANKLPLPAPAQEYQWAAIGARAPHPTLQQTMLGLAVNFDGTGAPLNGGLPRVSSTVTPAPCREALGAGALVSLTAPSPGFQRRRPRNKPQRDHATADACTAHCAIHPMW